MELAPNSFEKQGNGFELWIILGIFADVQSPICVRACVRVLLSERVHVGVCVMVAHVWF